MSNSDEDYMNLALKLAKQASDQDEVPVGAIIVKGGKIIAEAFNEKESLKLSTGHAELIAIERASRTLNSWRLSGCTLYVTLEPCIMCAGAIISARLDSIVYGTKDPKGGGVDSLYNILNDSRLNHQTQVTSGVLKNECSKILKDFFTLKRSN